MKIRSWSLMALTALLLACWAIPAMAAGESSQILRAAGNRGTFLMMTVLSDKGLPVPGVRVTAVGSDLVERSAVTGPDGVVELDGLPNDSRGTIAPFKNQTQTVSWHMMLESGKENRCTVQAYTVMQPNALLVTLPVVASGTGHTWEPVAYSGNKLPLRSSKILDQNAAPGSNAWQQLTFSPSSKGVITLAYIRPWEWNNVDLPKTNDWRMVVYRVIPRPKPKAAPAAPATEQPAAPAAPAAAPAAPKAQ